MGRFKVDLSSLAQQARDEEREHEEKAEDTVGMKVISQCSIGKEDLASIQYSLSLVSSVKKEENCVSLWAPYR